ncbi:MAG TPA: VOC family protein [Candidatus Binataceae bacterium]|nr:VOC family protein [Candidatus Binataceae bacterium]
MLKVDKMLHVMHAIESDEIRRQAEKFYLDVFASQTYYDARPVQGLERDETLTLIGKITIIPMCPVDDVSDVGKVIRSYGSRFMGVALKVKDIHQADAHMKSKGITPTYFDPIYLDVFFFTNPKETCGIPYEFCQVEMPNDLRLRPEWSPDWWRDHHPLAIEKLSSVATATDNLERTAKFYREVFEFEPLGEWSVESEGAKAAAFRVGDFVLEVMQPVSKGTALADFVASNGGGVYSLNFKVKSTAKAAEYLKSKNLRLLGDPQRRFSIDPRDSFGGRFTFVSEELPNARGR